MSNPTNQIAAGLLRRIEETRKTLHQRELMMAAVKSAATTLLVFAVMVLTESIAELDSFGRTFLFFTGSILAFIAAAFLLPMPLLRFLKIVPGLSDRDTARLIGSSFAPISDRLENMLDLSDQLNDGKFANSVELVEVAVKHFNDTTAEIRFQDAVSFVLPKKLALITGALHAVMLLAVLLPSTRFHDAAVRLLQYQKEFKPPAEFTFFIVPGNAEIVKGESVEIEAELTAGVGTDRLPTEATLSFAEDDVDVWETISLVSDSTGLFRYQFPPMKQSIRYRMIAGSILSDVFRISVIDRPFVRSMTVALTPPAYTRLRQEKLEENIGDILAFPGTSVRWTIIPSKEISSASVVFKDGADIPMTRGNGIYTAEFTILSPTSYYIELEDAAGNTNQNIIEYRIQMLADAYPSIAIRSPGKNIDVTEAMRLPMAFTVSDDFGVTQLKLKFRLLQSRYATTEQELATIIPFDSLDIKEGTLDYLWDLSLLGLVPEDVVEYHAEVFDNDRITGPKSTKSPSYLIRLPSMEEVFADADKSHDQAIQSMENSFKDALELKKELKELSDDMKRNQQMDWQKQKKAEDVLKKYDEIQKNLDAVNKTIDEMTKNLQRNNTLSSETLEKYLELQKALSELNSPEFQKAMKRLQDAMQNVSPEQMRDAMQQAQFNEEQFRQSIERTMNLLKRIQIEQKVDELVKRTEQMKQAQDALNEKTKEATANDVQKANELARQQDEIDKQLGNVQREMNDLRNKMQEFPKQMPMNNLDAAQRAANDNDIQNAIKQSAQQLRSMQMERAMTAQQQAAGGISEMQRQMSEMQEQLLNNQMQQTMNALRKTMQDLLQLSQRQEQLKNQSRSLDPNSQQFREIAQQQQNLQGDLNNIANALAELSQQSFAVTPEMGKQIGRAMGLMQQSMSAIEQRNGPSASAMQNESMAALNNAATQMQGAMKQLQQQGGQGGGSLLQQLRGMAMQQQQINMQTEQIGRQNGMSQQQMQELGRLGRQQDAVRKSLEQLQKEAKGSDERNRIMGDLQNIADEMKEVAEQMQQQQMNPNTVERQERILSRLLQAQRSMRERDFEQKRKSVIGITPFRTSPGELPQRPNSSKMQQDMQRAQEAGYSKEYLELIRKYYESLERKEQ